MRTDDITAICIFIEDVVKSPTPSLELRHRASIYAGKDVLESMRDMQRPVRGIGIDVSRPWRSRNTILGSESVRISMTSEAIIGMDTLTHYDYDIVAHTIKKSDKEIQWLKEIVKGNFLFSHLTEAKVSHRVVQ